MNFCPCCGTDLARYEPIERDGFRIEPSGGFVFGGADIDLSPSEHIMVMTLMAAYPDIVSRVALLERTDSNARTRILDVHLCRIRDKIERAGGPRGIIQSVPRRGFRWAGAAHAA